MGQDEVRENENVDFLHVGVGDSDPVKAIYCDKALQHVFVNLQGVVHTFTVAEFYSVVSTSNSVRVKLETRELDEDV